MQHSVDGRCLRGIYEKIGRERKSLQEAPAKRIFDHRERQGKFAEPVEERRGFVEKRSAKSGALLLIPCECFGQILLRFGQDDNRARH